MPATDGKVYWFAPWWGRTSQIVIPLRRSRLPGTCRSCLGKTLWRTMSTPWRIIHPPCTGLAPLDAGERQREVEQELDALVVLAKELGAVVLKSGRNYEVESRVPTGPCSWCGRPGFAITADSYMHCPNHLWPPYRWPHERKAS